jgi:uncharacterized protein (DUF362 family)
MRFDENKRNFIKKSVQIGLGAYGLSKLSHYFDGEVLAKSSDHAVVIARDQRVIDGNLKVDYAVVHNMLDDAVMKLAGTSTPSDAWRAFFKSSDIVGIKINTLSGGMMSSHPELVMAIVEGLKTANVKDIVIWDKSDDELERAGFKLNRKTSNDPRCFGTTPDVGYEDDISMYGSIASKLSRIMSYCTAFINVPVLKHHTMAGVTISLKNWFGAIHNPNKYHFDTNSSNKMVASCNYIPDVNALFFSELKKRQPLIICDGIMSQYDKGPGYIQSKTWKYSGLLVSSDPVALDFVGAKIIDKKRISSGVKSLADTGREPEYIAISADRFHNLGTNDPSKIELVSAGNLSPDIDL